MNSLSLFLQPQAAIKRFQYLVKHKLSCIREISFDYFTLIFFTDLDVFQIIIHLFMNFSILHRRIVAFISTSQSPISVTAIIFYRNRQLSFYLFTFSTSCGIFIRNLNIYIHETTDTWRYHENSNRIKALHIWTKTICWNWLLLV